MLYGEIMVPVYDAEVLHEDRPDRYFCFINGWDEATKTMTLDLWEEPLLFGS